MRRRGITLIELLLALSISVLVMMAAGNAYLIGTQTARTLGRGRDAIARRAALERDLRSLFSHAYLDADSTNTGTYFISGDSLAGKGATTDSSASSSGTGDAGTLVFTVLGRPLPSSLLASTSDFETNNEAFGPTAGATEIELGTSPIGDAASVSTGLFLREQAPSGDDPTQGGTQSLLSPDVDTISFEYFDGTDWQTTWDTTTMGTRRLPSAVRVTYRLTGDDADSTIVLPLTTSDVTPDNPVVQETAS